MRVWVFSLAVVMGGLALAGSGCGSEDKQAVPCTSDDTCAYGQICAATGFCETLPCGTNADCLAGNQACIEVSSSQVCAVVECGCATCGQCPVGESCDNGQCVFEGGGNTCPNGQTDCAVNQVCDNGSCRACQGTECPQSGCEETGCPTGQTCNTTSHQCETPQTQTAEACDTCANVEACGGTPWKCAPLVSGSSCLPGCADNDDCKTGWLCQGGNCVPSNFRCDGCMKDGCPSGQACNPNSNECIAAAAQCASCGNDWECGAGMACDNNECVPRCNAGTCPIGGSCKTSANQVEVCDNVCGASCDPACGGTTPICDAGTCVQCKLDTDCSAGQTCGAGGTCQGQQNCQAPTPIFWNGQCVQCTSNEHCGSGLFCNPQTNTCGSDVCSSCVDPYPACTQIGSDFYCVQCASDADCGLGGTCNQQTFACEGGTVTPTESCTSDADCDSGAQTGYVLHCDVASGYCYDESGGCDGVTAFCPGSDGTVHKCSSILDLFGSIAGGGGIPLPGGTTIPGSCACSAFPASTCLGGSCLDLGFLLCMFGGTDPLTCIAQSNGTGTCFDASSLGF
ncbi:MAG: hypothetical protein H6745_01715 [Deltaproteobacteria bacterium]|nr:hypothetical protein [Deltaproteobacteria bacterium]